MRLYIQVLNLLPCEVVTYNDVAVGTRDGVIAEVQLIEERVASRECDVFVGVEPRLKPSILNSGRNRWFA
jgi:hypothetical protein